MKDKGSANANEQAKGLRQDGRSVDQPSLRTLHSRVRLTLTREQMQFILDNMHDREPDHYEKASTLYWHHLRSVVRRRLERLLKPNSAINTKPPIGGAQ